LPSAPASGRLGRPDIFIILLDAARADSFSAYGSLRPTPVVDSLAAEGTIFTRALAPSSWTAPTTASLLSGRYPEAHGVEEWDLRLPDSITTLTEMLSDAGYYTFLGSHHNVYRGNRPLRRGFDGIELIDHRDRDTLPDPASMFDENRPTFALIHLLPPHTPYEPPPPFIGAYTAGSPAVFDVSDSSLNSYSRSRQTVPERAVRYARDRYDENVAYADALVGRLVDMLRDRGRYDDALIIVLSDHGEAFFEHGDFLHRKTLYDEVLRVPLVVKWPAGTKGYLTVVEAPVSLVDLAPTLLDGVGIDDSRAALQGISLLPGVFEGVESSRSIYASTRPTSRTHQPIVALYRLNKKLILENLSAPRLYDLSLDPLEQVDVSSSEPVVTQILLQEVRAQRRCNRILLTGAGQVPQIELDPERLRELRALGYIQ
jgi:arylsulfatase A-like enzyme